MDEVSRSRIRLLDLRSCDFGVTKKVIIFQDYVAKITKIVEIEFEKTRNA